MLNKDFFIPTSLDSEIIAELLPEFIREINEEFDKLYKGFENNDMDKVKGVAHKMNGACKSFGAYSLEKKTTEILSIINEKRNTPLTKVIMGLKEEVRLISEAYARE